MKKISTTFLCLLFFGISFSQTTFFRAGWDFESGGTFNISGAPSFAPSFVSQTGSSMVGVWVPVSSPAPYPPNPNVFASDGFVSPGINGVINHPGTDGTGADEVRSALTTTGWEPIFNENKYLEFTVRAATGYALKIFTLRFPNRVDVAIGSATNVSSTIRVRSSIDGFTNDLFFNSPVATSLVQEDGNFTAFLLRYSENPSFSTEHTSVSFRIYFNGQIGDGIRTDRVDIIGTVAPIVPLPLKLSAFEGYNQDGQNQLTWQTAFEQNVSHFEIERSLNGRDFVAIGTLSAKGESSVPVNYAFTDKSPVSNMNYYRLKQIDKDNSFTYSKIVSVLGYSNNGPFLNVLQNPGDGTQVKLQTNSIDVKSLQLYNMAGAQLPALVTNTGTMVTLKPITSLAKGMYIIRALATNGHPVSEKLIVH